MRRRRRRGWGKLLLSEVRRVLGEIAEATEQTIAAFKVLLYLGPVAVYALWLGLVNSQALPKLVKARDDFVVMTVAFCPLVGAVVAGLAQAGYVWTGVGVTSCLLLLFFRLLPSVSAGWVIYNLSPQRARIVADRALCALGWSYHWDGWRAVVEDHGLSLEISAVPLLRNVTFHVELREGSAAARVEALRGELRRRLDGEAGLPSVAGCCLLLAGAVLLVLPLWMLSHHSAAIAEVMTRILLS